MSCQQPPVWEVIYDPDFPMDYQDTRYVIEMLLKPVQDDIKGLEDRLNGTGGDLEISLDYTKITNKPSIESKELVGNVTLDEIGVQALSNADIDSIFA